MHPLQDLATDSIGGRDGSFDAFEILAQYSPASDPIRVRPLEMNLLQSGFATLTMRADDETGRVAGDNLILLDPFGSLELDVTTLPRPADLQLAKAAEKFGLQHTLVR